jgi:RNA polymerase sigma-70 factor (ECF subfamily)
VVNGRNGVENSRGSAGNRTDVDGTARGLWSTSMAQTVPIANDPRTGEFDEFYPRVWRYVLSLLHDRADAEDATQEAFLRAHQRDDSLHDPAAALPWLYSIATHVCLDRLRARSREAHRESGTKPDAWARPDESASAELRVQQNEMSACVQGLVGELSDGYRAVLLLHDVYGLSTPEIAAALGDTTGAVKIRLHRARGVAKQPAIRLLVLP